MPMRLLYALLAAGASVTAASEPPSDLPSQAMRLVEQRQFQAAAATLRQALKQSPSNPDLWNLLGIAEAELKHPKEARAAFEQGIRIAPDAVSLYENEGLLFFDQHDYQAARKTLERAVALGSRQPGVAFSLASSKWRTGATNEGLAELRGLESALETVPDYWMERGRAEALADPQAAERSFARAAELNSGSIAALREAAAAALAQKQEERALSYLIRARKLAPDDVETLVRFGALCLRRDLTVDALDALARAHRLAPADTKALYLYAAAQIGVQQWQEAASLMTEFIRRVPSYPQAHYALGWLHLQLDQAVEARQELEKCLQLSPGHAEALLALGQLDLDEDKLDSAQQRLQSVLRSHPQNAKANLALGDVALRKGEFAVAEERLRAAVAADPASGPAHYKLSTVLARTNRAEEAAREREIGARLNAEAKQASRTFLRLAEPDGSALQTGAKAAR